VTAARARRDELLARLVALWARGGHAAVGLDGRRCSRTEAEAEIIRLLRPLCAQVGREPVAAPAPLLPPADPATLTDDGADDAPPTDPEADPA
jgi:hypothetical protein